MPIGSIIIQPAANSLNAAYRPVILRISATKTGGATTPPVVYCDIYINDSFYRTITMTQYTKLNVSDTEWEFDIQDPCQEILRKYLGTNGGTLILNPTTIIASVYCKFRSSGINTDGFLIAEDTAPAQGSVGVDPISGTGTQSNTFFILNATLQHEDNQVLTSHLNSYKQRDWIATAYPLTHRTENYKICPSQSDYFPIVSDKQPGSIILSYREKNSNSFLNLGYNSPCELPLNFTSSETLPNGAVGVPYYFAIGLEGSLPITIDSTTKPSWMTIAINAAGTLLEFSGTPDTSGTNIPVQVSISNCCGTTTLEVDELIDIVSCVGVAFGGAVSLPDPVVNTPYVYDISLTGTPPFSLSNMVKPDWMTITINGSTIELRGTPDESDFGTDIEVSFDITNCGGTINVDDLIDIVGGYECGEAITENTADGNYHQYTYLLNIAPGTTTVNLFWNTDGDRPNRFTLYKDGFFVESTGWKGYANYPGPWGGGPLNTAQNGTITFNPVLGSGYKLFVEVGNWDPLNNQADNFTVSIQCL